MKTFGTNPPIGIGFLPEHFLQISLVQTLPITFNLRGKDIIDTESGFPAKMKTLSFPRTQE